MKSEGDIFLFKFPLTNQFTGKRRPVVLLKKIPNQIADWLVCMVSSRLHNEVQGVDLVMRAGDENFEQTGFRKDSLIRATCKLKNHRVKIILENKKNPARFLAGGGASKKRRPGSISSRPSGVIRILR